MCGNGIIEPPNEQCEPTDAGPCPGNSPCNERCLCPGNSCHELPERGCTDHDDCTDDDSCREGNCTGDRKCRVEVPVESSPSSSTVPVTIEGTPGAKCMAKILRVLSPDTATRAATARADVLSADEVDTGRSVSTSKRGRIASDGRLVLEPKLNRVAKKLLKKNGSLQAVVKIRIAEPGGKHRLLKSLVRLVRD
jgi:hypothetical protein